MRIQKTVKFWNLVRLILEVLRYYTEDFGVTWTSDTTGFRREIRAPPAWSFESGPGSSRNW